MFEIIKPRSKLNKNSIKSAPVLFLAKPGVHFRPGNAVSFIEYDGVVCCDIANERTIPIGLIEKYKYIKSFNYMLENMIYVWVYNFKFRTDVCAGSIDNYELGDFLYINNTGILTNEKPHDDSINVAKVNSIITRKNKLLECYWI